ncbi:MAG: hypothetical protein ACI97A_001652 [Planctomycetota bacterium]|jgi:hypothetical protein
MDDDEQETQGIDWRASQESRAQLTRHRVAIGAGSSLLFHLVVATCVVLYESSGFLIFLFGFIQVAYTFPLMLLLLVMNIDTNYLKGVGITSALLFTLNTLFCGVLIF